MDLVGVSTELQASPNILNKTNGTGKLELSFLLEIKTIIKFQQVRHYYFYSGMGKLMIIQNLETVLCLDWKLFPYKQWEVWIMEEVGQWKV